jgi:hypothetical protein
MNDLAAKAPQAAVIVLGTLTFALFCWLPQPTPEPVKDECQKPIYLPTADDTPVYTWQWPLQEEQLRRKHRRG